MKYSNIQEEDARSMKGFGYFTPDDLDIGVHAKDFVDHAWPSEERNKVLNYLRDCYSTCYTVFERLPCYICNEFDVRSSQDMTDGGWVFPQALIHYVEQHHVVPAKPFLEHIRNNNYQVPELPDDYKVPEP